MATITLTNVSENIAMKTGISIDFESYNKFGLQDDFFGNVEENSIEYYDQEFLKRKKEKSSKTSWQDKRNNFQNKIKSVKNLNYSRI